MVNIAQIRQWKPEILEEIRNELRRDLDELTTSGDDYAKLELGDGDWGGGAAQKAMQAHRELMRQGDHRAAGLAACIKAIEQACDAIPPAKDQITEAETHGQKWGFQISEDGHIDDTFAGKPLPPDMNPEDRKRAHDEIRAKLDQVVLTATDIGHDLTVVFNQAGGGGYGTGQETTLSAASSAGTNSQTLTTPEPPQGNNPVQNAAWWATLSKEEQKAATLDPVNKIGNRDGIPASNRSTANMHALKKSRSDLAARVASMRKNMPDIVPDSKHSVEEYEKAQRELKEAEGKLKAVNNIDGVMKQGGRQLVHFDTGKPLVQAAVSNGNLDTASNVAVFTPGFTTNISDDTSLSQYDKNMADLKMASDRMLGPKGDTAAVTWIGYQPPQADVTTALPNKSVGSPIPAEHGGKDLADFYNGIGSVHHANKTPLHLTALGHSYGSTTTGYALGHDTPVNDAVLFGSPGQGAGKLNVPDGHLYSEKTSSDPIPEVNGTLGPSPYYDSPQADRFQELSTDKSSEGGASSGHGGYLDEHSTSLHNMASITAGRPERAVFNR